MKHLLYTLLGILLLAGCKDSYVGYLPECASGWNEN